MPFHGQSTICLGHSSLLYLPPSVLLDGQGLMAGSKQHPSDHSSALSIPGGTAGEAAGLALPFCWRLCSGWALKAAQGLCSLETRSGYDGSMPYI